jgi:osmotically-inducible protein OsmY
MVMKKRYIFILYFVVPILIATFIACASTPHRESTGEYLDDSVITTKVKAILVKDEALKAFHISVKTYRGVVQLKGSVDSQKTIDKAGQIARDVEGVKSVENNLVLKPAAK